MLMHATVTSCGGTDHDAGLWDVAQTPKLLTFKLVEPPAGMGVTYLHDRIKIMKCRRDNNGPHCVRDWGDGTYTVYPDRGGTPYVFTPANGP